MAQYAYTFTSGDTVTPTKLNNARTVSNIVNADIKSDAAIAGTKIAPAFGAQNITVGSADRSITNTTNHALAFGTNNTERMRIANNGQVVIGHNAPVNVTGNAGFEGLQLAGTGSLPSATFSRYSNDASGLNLSLVKSRSGSTASVGGAVVSGDTIANLVWRGDDGTNVVTAAQILAAIDGTPGTNDMPGRLVFSTTADGGSSSTERMRITSAGNVGIANTSPSEKLHVTGNIKASGYIDADTSFRGQASDSASAPSFTWTDDTNTGMFRPAEDTLAFCEGGVEAMRINSSGSVGIGTTSPTVKLDVNGIVNTNATYRVNGEIVVGARRGGWGTPSGNIDRTTYTVSTVTVAQLAARVNALIRDLQSHGLIGS